MASKCFMCGAAITKGILCEKCDKPRKPKAEAKEHPMVGDLIRGWTAPQTPPDASDGKAMFWQGFYAR